MDAIHVVTPNDIQNHLEQMLLHALFSGVQPTLASVTSNPGWMRIDDMVRRYRPPYCGIAGAIRIKPGMQFQTAFVRFLNRERERIIEWKRRLPHRSGQIF